MRRAITLDEQGKLVEGPTKNKYSRKIRLNEPMLEALREQKKFYEKFRGEYLFCAPRMAAGSI